MAVKAFMVIETDNIEKAKQMLEQHSNYLVNNHGAKPVSRILCYDANSRHDKVKLSMLAEVIDDILPEELPADELAKLYLFDDEATDLYDAIHKLQETLRNAGY